MTRLSEAPVRIAADVGGTFTDVVCFDEVTGKTTYGKQLSTSEHIVVGIEAGIAEAGTRFADATLFFHGATVAINALLERRGALTALVTTKGFRDVYEIGRINRPDAYNLFFRKHVPLVERALRFELNERILTSGDIVRPVNDTDVEALASQLRERGVEAVAIAFLNSYRNPIHEAHVKDLLTTMLPGVFITASYELAREYREYERTSTAVANAYIGPKVKTYLDELERRAKEKDFSGNLLLVQSTGGLFNLAQARSECLRMLESGPAAGVVGVQTLCKAMGETKAIAFDMGGTTAKAGVILNGQPLGTQQVMIGGYNEGLPAQIPTIDIQEVGTGGGSIARAATGGGLRVGPQSAGSNPGPVCYGYGGTQPTVTDANLVLGRIAADKFLGGTMLLDSAAAREAIRTQLAEPLGLDIERVAEGVLRIAVAAMANVVRRVTTERGLNVEEFPLFAFGGAGPLHAVAVARELRLPKVIIPPSPGHFSAFGMLAADLRRDYVQTLFTKLAGIDFSILEARFEEMEAAGRAEVAEGATNLQRTETHRSLDMRYVGQEHAVTVPIPNAAFAKRDVNAIKAAFDAEHLLRYAFFAEHEPAEIVSIRTSVRGIMTSPSFSRAPEAALPAISNDQRMAYLDGEHVTAAVYRRTDLRLGATIDGPALIDEHATTTVIHRGNRATVDAFGNIVIKLGK